MKRAIVAAALLGCSGPPFSGAPRGDGGSRSYDAGAEMRSRQDASGRVFDGSDDRQATDDRDHRPNGAGGRDAGELEHQDGAGGRDAGELDTSRPIDVLEHGHDGAGGRDAGELEHDGQGGGGIAGSSSSGGGSSSGGAGGAGGAGGSGPAPELCDCATPAIFTTRSACAAACAGWPPGTSGTCHWGSTVCYTPGGSVACGCP